jgi:hypothetical protein
MLRIGIRKQGISIIANSDSSGRIHHCFALGERPDVATSDRGRLRAEKLAMVSLAGMEAQRKFSPRSVRNFHASSDYQNAVDLMSHYTCSDEELGAYLRLLLVRTRQLVSLPDSRTCVGALVAELTRRKKLSGSEVNTVLCAAMSGPSL